MASSILLQNNLWFEQLSEIQLNVDRIKMESNGKLTQHLDNIKQNLNDMMEIIIIENSKFNILPPKKRLKI